MISLCCHRSSSTSSMSSGQPTRAKRIRECPPRTPPVSPSQKLLFEGGSRRHVQLTSSLPFTALDLAFMGIYTSQALLANSPASALPWAGAVVALSIFLVRCRLRTSHLLCVPSSQQWPERIWSCAHYQVASTPSSQSAGCEPPHHCLRDSGAANWLPFHAPADVAARAARIPHGAASARWLRAGHLHGARLVAAGRGPHAAARVIRPYH